MLLDRIDIDVHGPLHHVALGPFAEHLNVVYAPRGSGKTAIARFLRDSLLDRDYPRGMLSASTGRVVWADRNGLVHCRREQDGTPQGRRTVEFESRGSAAQAPTNNQSWLGDIYASTASGRALESLKLPESIVDGVITDTAISSLARVVSACVRGGLDSPQNYQSLPLHDDPYDGGRDVQRDQRLRSELAEIEAELARLGQDLPDPALDTSGARTRLAELHRQAHQLRARQSELYRWIDEIDRTLLCDSAVPSAYVGSAQAARYQANGAIADERLRRQLDDLDAQMIHWRRALAEVRGLRSAIRSDDYRDVGSLPYSDFGDASLRNMRLRGFLHAIDRYGGTYRPEHFYAGAYRPLHAIDDIEHRIGSATRQLDWLLDRYRNTGNIVDSWYEGAAGTAAYRGTSGLGEALRRIRQDLEQVRASALRGNSTFAHETALPGFGSRFDELQHAEGWLAANIDQLDRRRQNLIQDAGFTQDAEASELARPRVYDINVLHRDRTASKMELDRVTAELDACLRVAAELRRTTRVLPVIDRRWHDEVPFAPSPVSAWGDRHDDTAGQQYWREMPPIHGHRAATLYRRRDQILEQLQVAFRPAGHCGPLATVASQWLVRLSGGRLRQVSWPHRAFHNDQRSYHRRYEQPTGVLIDGRDEMACRAADRALAVLAVRMAAADLLARAGRPVPLVLEVDATLAGIDPDDRCDADPYCDHGVLARYNFPIVAALNDFARSGSQVVVMTSDQQLADQIARVGARAYKIRSQPVVHAHRPLWKPHYQGEQYYGPHPHTYGHRDSAIDARYRVDTAGDINRDFDAAWHEAYGVSETYEPADQVSSGDRRCDTSERTDWLRDGAHLRDGCYVAPSYTTAAPDGIDSAQGSRGAGTQPFASPASPFFLTVDSPIDQAPSIDAVAAARLRGLQVTHVNHLMQQDSNRLADALGLASVDAATIRRWQAECRLVCRVPHLRGFDARVLVGCGVRTPAQLAAIHPVDLLQQVEAFLSTEQGQQILLSGSSHELSRITSWIAAANAGDESALANFGRRRRSSDRSRSNGSRRSSPNRRDWGHDDSFDDSDYPFDSARYEYETDSRAGRRRRGRSLRATRRNHSAAGETRSGQSSRKRGSKRSRSTATASSRSQRSSTSLRRSGERTLSAQDSRRSRRNGAASPRKPRSNDFVSYRNSEHPTHQSQHELKFYLQRESPVVDAPSIGSRMAERLNAIDIFTVDDLLTADHESVAEQLDHRRVDAETVLQWQQQATLVCRVPMLRGHDAQLLVAAEITTPEELAAYDADDLFAIIDPIARSNEGKRIIRGGKRPDLDEVTEWIRYGREHRELVAA